MFNADGYIDRERYDGVLFILKESNLVGYTENEKPYEREQVTWYRNFFNDSGKERRDNNPKQKEKMGRMACWILNQNQRPSDDEIKDGLRCSAFMNLNKRGGSNRERTVSAYTKSIRSLLDLSENNKAR